MLTFISCAKTMASHCSLKVPEVTVPYFEAEAVRNALEMSQVSAAELEKLLKVNAKIAAENKVRFMTLFGRQSLYAGNRCIYGSCFQTHLTKGFYG